MTEHLRLAALFVAALPLARAAEPAPWVTRDAAGHLQYRTTLRGDRIMDFSSAGYGGGGVPLPTVPTVETLAPSGSDDTAALQTAVAQVLKHPLKDGFHGALQLGEGTFHCFAALRLSESGIVVRGTGSGLSGGTTIELTGHPHRAFELGKEGRNDRSNARELLGQGVKIVQDYVPSGATTVEVSSTARFAPGDNVAVVRPVTREWVKFMGMADLVRSGRSERWVSGAMMVERKITAVHGNHLDLDVPLTDAVDSKFQRGEAAEVAQYAPVNRVAQVGLESLRIVSPPQHLTLGQSAFTAVAFRQVEDGWMRDVAIQDTMDSVQISSGSRRVTIERVDIKHETAITGAALPADFGIDGSQVLLDRCHDRGNRVFYVVTGPQVGGPNVVLRCVFEGDGSIMPHQRWATGLLVDQCQVPQGSIEFKNRGQMGSGHGWTIGWAVAWNCVAPTFVVQDPPGVLNWAIGCVGTQKLEPMPFGKAPMLAQGEIESEGHPVQPESLYLAQLSDRLGAK